MTGHLTHEANLARQNEMHAQAAHRRSALAPSRRTRIVAQVLTADSIAIRRAIEDDRIALVHLAALDSAEPLAGEILIAEVDDEPRAAIEIATGITVADPFRRTAHLVDLLSLRAAMLRERGGSRRRLRLRLRARSAYRAA
jgi:hypothetical protein